MLDPASLTMIATLALGNYMRPGCERQQKRYEATPCVRTTGSAEPLISNNPAVTEMGVFGSAAQNITFKYDHLVAQIEKFADFPLEWDGEGTTPPSSAAVAAAKSFISNLKPGISMPTAMLTGSGALEFFWNSKDGYADISFDQSGTASFFGRDSKNEEFFIDEIHSDAAGLLQTDRQILAVIARHLI